MSESTSDRSNGRIPDLDTLMREVRHWRASVDRKRPIQWNFRVTAARRVFRYDGIKSTRSAL